jgi:hypothetical protein
MNPIKTTFAAPALMTTRGMSSLSGSAKSTRDAHLHSDLTLPHQHIAKLQMQELALHKNKENDMKNTIKSILVATAMTLATACAQASTPAKSDFIVQALSANPGFAQNTSQDLLLHSNNNGATYLYVEQRNGAVLSIFDVTNPARMTLAASVHLEARGTYNFVTPIGGGAELIAFRDGSGTAVLDLRKVKNPRVISMARAASAPTEMLGTAGYLSVRQAATATAPTQLRDVQLVEASHSPRPLTTVTSVSRQVTNPETGTIFLLGHGQITVIRRLDSEQDYAVRQVAREN